MHKVHREHFRAGHYPEEFGVIAQLHVIVRRGSSGAGELVRCERESINNLIPQLARKALYDTALIKNNANKLKNIRNGVLKVIIAAKVHRRRQANLLAPVIL